MAAVVRTCPIDGVEFVAFRRDKLTCSSRCRKALWRQGHDACENSRYYGWWQRRFTADEIREMAAAINVALCTSEHEQVAA